MDEIQKSVPTPAEKKAAAQERMAKARAARQFHREKPQPAPEAADVTLQRTARTQLRQDGRIEAVGRNGEVLSRTRTQNVDPFDVPVSMIPKGWEYQWNPVTVTGNGDIVRDMQMTMYSNGWRPVPADRHAGILVETGSKGTIIRGQMILEERPKALSDEARAEDLRSARQLISDRNESLKLTKVKDQMGDGFEMRNQHSGVRMQIDKSLDVANLPRPEHKVAE